MKYVAVIEQSILWEEETETVEEAIEMLRGLIETDKRYSFAGTTSFKWTSRAETAKKTMIVKWGYEDENGKYHTMSKRIYIKDYHPIDEGIKPRKKQIEDWGIRWERTRKMFL